MKKYLLLTFCSFLYISCIDSNKKFTGYLVCKEYTPERMCCDNTKTMQYAGYIPITPRPVVNTHKHTRQDAEYYFYIANKDNIKKKKVSKDVFNKNTLGSKLIVNYY